MRAMTVGARLPLGYPRAESYAMQDTASTTLGLSARDGVEADGGDSGFRPLPIGVDALVARIVLADFAERSLDVQYYIWHDDLTGRLFTDALLRAADRGVRVRVLVDDVGTKANDQVLLNLDSHANVQIRLFNPVALRNFRGLGMLSDFARTNRRMHNKAFVADNQRAVLGGRNIGDEYFEAQLDVAFGDLDVLMLGSVVGEVSKSFDIYWNAPMSIPIEALTGRAAMAGGGLTALRMRLKAFVEAQADNPYVRHARSAAARHLAAGSDGLFWGKGRLLVDDPEKATRPPEDTRGHLLPQLASEIAQPRHDLLIVSPYFIPGDAGVAWLRTLVEQGVRVTVLTNSLASTDVGAVHAGYQRYREALLEGGVRLFELKPTAVEYGRAKNKSRLIIGSRASLHAKTFVFDRRTVFIGSLNLDPRSIQLNTEIGVICDSERMAAALASGVEAGLDHATWQVQRLAGADGKPALVWTETTPGGARQYTDEPGVNVWRRLGVWFLAFLPVESQL
jgi:putative cardiolipin synthase